MLVQSLVDEKERESVAVSVDVFVPVLVSLDKVSVKVPVDFLDFEVVLLCQAVSDSVMKRVTVVLVSVMERSLVRLCVRNTVTPLMDAESDVGREVESDSSLVIVSEYESVLDSSTVFERVSDTVLDLMTVSDELTVLLR